MEERRAGAAQVQVSTAATSQPEQQTRAAGDLVQRLATLKAMLEQGLITQDEFDQRKAAILAGRRCAQFVPTNTY